MSPVAPRQEAVDRQTRRRRSDWSPRVDHPHYYRASAFYHLGLLDLAEREVQLGVEIDPGNSADSTRQRMISALYTGRFAEAIKLGLDVRRIAGSRAWDYFLGQAYYYSGQREGWRPWS